MYQKILNNIIKKNTTIYKDNNVKITYIDNSSKEVLIIFSYAVNPPDNPREHISAYLKEDKNIIHVVDLKCSWFNNFTPQFLLDKIKHLVDNKKIYLFGASMGGFNAIYFSNFIKSEKCIAFGPQFSISKEKMVTPNIIDLVNSIDCLTINSLMFNDKTKYIVLFGNDKEEINNYSNIIPQVKKNNINFTYIIFGKSPHEVFDYIGEFWEYPSQSLEHIINSKDEDIIDFYKNVDLSLPSVSILNNTLKKDLYYDIHNNLDISMQERWVQ